MNLLIQGTYPGLTAPDHVDHLLRDYSLLTDSPAIDQGIDVPVFKDFTGKIRAISTPYDVGAFEY